MLPVFWTRPTRPGKRSISSRISGPFLFFLAYAMAGAGSRELRREIRGVTEKMLIQTLRNLERDGIVARKVYPTVPPRVEYSMSELGWSLAPILDAIIDWS